MPRKFKRNNYTIIELLLVILVIGIMLGIGVGGIDRAIRGSGTTGGIRNIGSRLTVARSFAVSSNQKIAVVFPMVIKMGDGSVKDPLSSLSDTVRNKYLFRSLRVCVVSYDTSVTPHKYRFVRWCENDDWTYLPAGTYCNFYFEGTANDPALVYEVDMRLNKTDSAAPLADVTAKGMPGIVYSAGGGLDPNMGTPDIKLVVFEDKFNAGIGSEGTFMLHGIEPKNDKVDKGWSYNLNPFTGLGVYDKTKGKLNYE